MRKPDPAIYRLALEQLGVAPERALFLDDRADNVAAARRLGFVGHHSRDAESLRRALSERGLIAGYQSAGA